MGEEQGGVSSNGLRRVYRALCNLAWCDGQFDPREKQYLDEFRAQHGISPAEGAALEQDGREGNNLAISKRPAEQELLLAAMIDVAAADKVVTAEEQERLIAFGRTLGMTDADLAREIRDRLVRQGKTLQKET